MPTPRRTAPRSLPDALRRKLDVTTAMAWENLVETHVTQATAFVNRLTDHMPVEDSLTRYLREMDMNESMATAIRTRVLLTFEETGLELDEGEQLIAGDVEPAAPHITGGASEDDPVWRRFRPSAVVREVKERQRKSEELDNTIMLLLARAEDHVMAAHVENAIGFAALLDEALPLDRAVQHYLGAVTLTGCRAQVVFQKTMSRLADVHLPGQG